MFHSVSVLSQAPLVCGSSALPSILLEKRLAFPTSPFFHFLVNVFSVISEGGSALYVGLARAIPPTNTNFRLTFLLTQSSGGYL